MRNKIVRVILSFIIIVFLMENISKIFDHCDSTAKKNVLDAYIEKDENKNSEEYYMDYSCDKTHEEGSILPADLKRRYKAVW